MTAVENVCDIIQNQLSLAQGRVYLFDQKINMPNDGGLFIAVQVLSCKPFGASTFVNSSGNEVQSVNMQATLSIDLMSRSTEALDRKEELIMALGSQYAEASCETNSFYIAPISTGFVNLSEADGAAILYRYNISVNIQYFVTKTQVGQYYTTASNTVLVNQ